MKESVVFSFEESMTDVKGHVKFRDYLIEKISLLFFCRCRFARCLFNTNDIDMFETYCDNIFQVH